MDLEVLSNIYVKTFNPFGNSNISTMDFFHDPYGYMWIITKRGLYRFDGVKVDDTFNSTIAGKGIANKLHSLKVRNNESITLGTNDGKFYELNLIDRTLEQKNKYSARANEHIYRSKLKLLDSRGNQWLSRNGLWLLTPEKRFLIKEIPESRSINAIREINNEIWIGHNSGDISRISNYNDPVINYKDFDGLNITAITEDNSTLFIASNSGLFSYDRVNGRSNKLLEDNVLSLSLFDNYLWLGTTSGIKKYNISKQSIEEVFLPGLKIISIYIHESTLLGITMFNGIYQYSSRSPWLKISKTETLLDSVYIDGRDNWISLTTGAITSNLLNINGRHYLGSLESGILDSSLSGSAITSINRFKDQIVFSGREGIGFYNPKSDSHYWATNYDFLDWGSINTNSSAISVDNELFLGRSNGLIKIDLDIFEEGIPRSHIKVYDISIINSNKSILLNNKSESIVLKWPYRSFSFSFRVKNTKVENIRYKYKLENYNNKWVTNTLKGEYKNIPPGDYSLIINADTPYKELLDLTESISVKVLEPFWFVPTFWIITLFFLVLTVVTVILLIKLRRERLKNLKKSVVLDERNRIARELHDSVSQTLFSASITADIIPELLRKNETAGLKKIEELNSLTKGAQVEMRTLLYELRPDIFNNYNFKEILVKLIETFDGKSDVVFTQNIYKTNDLDDQSKLVIYRVLQEAINNSLKHSRCRKIDIKFSSSNKGFKLLVVNDGDEFNPDIDHNGMGLKLISERAESIGALLKIESDKGYTHYSLIKGEYESN